MRRMLLVMLLLVAGAWAVEPGEVELQAGNALMEQRKYAEALAKYQEGLKVAPSSHGMLYNAGLAAYLTGDGAMAVSLWKQLKALEPDDWRLAAKLIQAYQLAGDLPSRDAERAALIAAREAGTNPELAKQNDFCRDQLTVDGRQVLVYEAFKMQGPRGVRYLFIVIKNDKREPYYYSLGSYDDTTNFAREAKEIKPDQRIWHLDYYAPNGHATYGFYVDEPKYEVVKEAVRGALAGTLKPLSSSTSKPK